jgi:hypothetical protein
MAIELLWAPNNPQDFLSADDVRAGAAAFAARVHD